MFFKARSLELAVIEFGNTRQGPTLRDWLFRGVYRWIEVSTASLPWGCTPYPKTV